MIGPTSRPNGYEKKGFKKLKVCIAGSQSRSYGTTCHVTGDVPQLKDELSLMALFGFNFNFNIQNSITVQLLIRAATPTDHLSKQEAQLLLGDRATRKHAKDC